MNTKLEDRVKEILALHSSAEQKRLSIWDSFHRDVRDYIRPRRTRPEEVGSSLIQPTWYDGTASQSSRILSNFFQSALIPQSVQWFGYTIPMGHPLFHLNESPATKDWLNTMAQLHFTALANSNFYGEAGAAFDDLTSYSTSGLFTDRIQNQNGSFSLNFEAMAVEHFSFIEGQGGAPKIVFQPRNMTTLGLMEEYSLERLPDKIQKMINEKKFNDRHNIIRAVFPRTVFETDAGNRAMPFASMDILVEGKHALRESGFEEFPYAIARFDKQPSEQYGRGLSFIAMPEIKSGNFTREIFLETIEKFGRPPIITSDEGALKDFDLSGGTISYSTDPSKVVPLKLAFDFKAALAGMQDTKQQIREIFGSDKIFLPNKPNMTAEEVMTLRNQANDLFGPNVGRFEGEGLRLPLFRSLNIMARAGALPPPPDEARELDVIDIEFVGQLAQAQKKRSVDAFDTLATKLIGVVKETGKRELLELINWEDEFRDQATKTGVNSKSLKSPDEYKEVIDQLAQAQAQQDQEDTQLQESEAIRNVTPAAKLAQEQEQGAGLPN